VWREETRDERIEWWDKRGFGWKAGGMYAASTGQNFRSVFIWKIAVRSSINSLTFGLLTADKDFHHKFLSRE
jgi:hypothetical protein